MNKKLIAKVTIAGIVTGAACYISYRIGIDSGRKSAFEEAKACCEEAFKEAKGYYKEAFKETIGYCEKELA